MRKYKEGDVVIITSNKDRNGWNEHMRSYACGQKGVITEVRGIGNRTPYRVSTSHPKLADNGRGGWWYNESDLIPHNLVPEDLFIL